MLDDMHIHTSMCMYVYVYVCVFVCVYKIYKKWTKFVHAQREQSERELSCAAHFNLLKSSLAAD